LARYLAYEYLPVDHSIFDGVKKLLPGHCMVFKAGNVTTRKYWDINFYRQVDVACEEEAEDRLQVLLRDAVKKRLISDVPLGVFLSGGIDSSAVVSFMSEFLPGDQVKTFSIGFADAAFDESTHARRVAERFGTNHHEETFSSDTLLSLVPEVAGFLDEPFADSSVFPTYLLSKFTRRNVTVALGGDGGDELFAGYPTFQAHRVAGFYEKFPRIIRRLIRDAVQHLPVSFDGISLDFQLKRFMKGMEFSDPERQQVWLGASSPAEQHGLLRQEALETLGDFDPLGDIHRLLHGVRVRDRFDLITYLYFKFYLLDDILAKVDRASMAASLEVRAPFLDKDVVEFVTALPSGYKLKGFRTKHLLKRAMRSRLPREIIHRRKKGFGVPISRWLAGPLKNLALEHFSPARLRRQGLFDEKCVSRLLREHLEGRRDNRKPLWTLLMFQMWYERYIAR
jgi:asparagine synthase (glutamine-hydrolysing)